MRKAPKPASRYKMKIGYRVMEEQKENDAAM